jgi:hypothetical protein
METFKRLFFSIFVLFFLLSWPIVAQEETFKFWPGGTYDPNIPTPESILGYQLGDHYSYYHEMVDYIKALEKSTPRVKVVQYGTSFERRKLFYLVISSEENMSKIEEIRANIAKLADPRKLSSADEAEAIIKSSPAIAFLAYSVHGPEASHFEAAMQTAYQLAAGTDKDTLDILDKLVTIIIPAQNPDGHESFVEFQNTVNRIHPNPDPNDISNNLPREYYGGLHNINRNRDWFLVTTPETKYKIQAFLHWHPQSFSDFHEMGVDSPYFFFPPRKPINQNIPPSHMKWWEIYGKGLAATFDRFGYGYYTKESFDMLFPGFGDSWPSLNGAIGMTYEKGGGGMGEAVKRNDGTVLTLKQRVHEQFIASMGTLLTTVKNREERLRDYYDFCKTGLDEGRNGAIKQFVLLPLPDPDITNRLIGTLLKQGIEIYKAQNDFSSTKAHDYFTDKVMNKNFAAGSFIIDLEQPAKRLTKALLEPRTYVDKKETFFYDITAWSLPLHYGVEAYWLEDRPAVDKQKVEEKPKRTSAIVGSKATYAYLLKNDSINYMKALGWLLQKDYNCYLSTKEFTIVEQDFKPGTIVIIVNRNPESIHEAISKITEKFGITAYAANTALSEKGIDLGSDHIATIKKPKVVVLLNGESDIYWHLLDYQFGIMATFMPVHVFKRADLREYNVIIFPNDTPDSYKQALDKAALEKLTNWIREGGTFIGIKGAALYACKEEKDKKIISGFSSVTAKQKSSAGDWMRMRREADRPQGAIFRIKLNNEHPLAYGYGEFTNILCDTKTIFAPEHKANNVAIYPEKSWVSGFIPEGYEEKLKGTPYLTEENFGRGRIILFQEEPNFRAHLPALNRLLLNSILFGPSLDYLDVARREMR